MKLIRTKDFLYNLISIISVLYFIESFKYCMQYCKIYVLTMSIVLIFIADSHITTYLIPSATFYDRIYYSISIGTLFVLFYGVSVSLILELYNIFFDKVLNSDFKISTQEFMSGWNLKFSIILMNIFAFPIALKRLLSK